ncbi:uncharacterized protein [Fopius arisanus]|uniref:Glycosyltransferase family 92 protein n=1 Tax=Fopius arisanus TaxID=64838 RepID=A0A0C9QZF2_9HYME|nr:PREDICTED: uncharacterized protein LOC105266703 [Fopius arisanus]
MSYQLLHKPIVSNWTMSRYCKVTLTLIGIIIGLLFIFVRSREYKLRQIYKLQNEIADIIDFEMEYMTREIFTEGDKWLPVAGINGHIYSAYFDPRPEVILKYSRSSANTFGEIFIVALLPTNTQSQHLTCVLQFEDNDRQTIFKKIPAQLRILNDHWDLEYSAFFIICDLTYKNLENAYDYRQLPEAVRIVHHHEDDDNGQFVDMHYPKYGMKQLSQEKSDFMAVCVPVLHHNFNRALELIEFIEYYEMMGINHFTLYNSSVTPEVDKVLTYYRTKLTATILNWNLPSIYVYEQTLRHEGLFAALNDCLYRNTHHHSYKYVGTFDVDEFLVPRQHDNFRDLMRDLDLYPNQNDSAGFIFRNVYFYTMYPDNVASRKKVPYLYTRAKTERLKMPHEPGKRSRYVVRGKDTVEIGNYNIWEFREGSLMSSEKEFKEYIVNPETALLHHYAPCEAEETGCYLKSIETDDIALRFTERLASRVEKTCSTIFGADGCPPPRKRIFGSE